MPATFELAQKLGQLRNKVTTYVFLLPLSRAFSKARLMAGLIYEEGIPPVLSISSSFRLNKFRLNPLQAC